jgi:methylated-DNA-[protein]-cysteine S-methyltransferase
VAHVSLLTPIGYLSVFSDGNAVIAIEFGRVTTSNTIDNITKNARQQLNAYFDGSLRQFDLPLNPTGTVFQQAVWRAILNISFSKTRTYSDIAADVSSSARAVGGACAANPIPIIIPCHRVLGKGGMLGGYSGGEGPETKQVLLRREGALLI